MNVAYYRSPLGFIRLCEKNGKLVSASFSGEGIFDARNNSKVLDYAVNWLGGYFAGSRAPFKSSLLAPEGTDFQKSIWRILLDIPYGSTFSYADVARIYNSRRSVPTSPRAVGGAVGKNPVLIVIPCHRVICSDGSPGGFAFGLTTKLALLEHEKN